jgi:catechol 2,3-dioxygenase-like lactoylglutathione lyase family enzyme
VANIERSVRFYGDVLGATESFRVGEGLVFLKLPSGRGVIALDGRPEKERNPRHFGLAVEDSADLDGAVASVLSSGGSLIERGEHAPGVSYAYVADPDGNVFEL